MLVGIILLMLGGLLYFLFRNGNPTVYDEDEDDDFFLLGGVNPKIGDFPRLSSTYNNEDDDFETNDNEQSN
jgi:hypothetical protein